MEDWSFSGKTGWMETGYLRGLPYGWEEAYTADGVKYYINHMTQTTSWSLPVTSGSGAPGPSPPPQTSEQEGDGEASDRRPSPSIETEM
ncbi:transcriptional coactivator YAP1-like isoform X2 [Acanthopagrus latus]|uniref:transcriptional coactivator YAP1-like isoform X2 n=1 Tax=Acanthopagrus latus TaxID=8177 RepID=UPI00187C7625|nr:transcriptional coactivator YAP1-like isoform X2 [Acanthopagrus latus]